MSYYDILKKNYMGCYVECVLCSVWLECSIDIYEVLLICDVIDEWEWDIEVTISLWGLFYEIVGAFVLLFIQSLAM